MLQLSVKSENAAEKKNTLYYERRRFAEAFRLVTSNVIVRKNILHIEKKIKRKQITKFELTSTIYNGFPEQD